MIESIEKYKKLLNEATNNNGDWKSPYENLMRELYKLPVIFFALSRDNYDETNKKSTPLISTKDFNGTPALYVFSDVDLASKWMIGYRHTTDDLKYGLIGAINKEPHDFLYVFQMARALGAQKIMLDEGGDWVGIDINYFMEVNSISTKQVSMLLTEEQFKEVIADNKPPTVRFFPISLIPLK